VYIPKHFEEKRVPVLHAFMAAHPFATLVTMSAAGLIASHIPIVLERDGTELGVLRGHLSRANPQWRGAVPGVEALAIFHGPEQYITPAWYPEKVETGKVVPTWNYVAVHAYGPLRIVEDAAWLREHLETLTNAHEAQRPEPWRVSDAPEEYVATMAKGIVGFELPVTRLEGKWKVSQNRSEEDRRGIQAGLDALGTPEGSAMQALVKERS
jgi:transcriptional regulator